MPVEIQCYNCRSQLKVPTKLVSRGAPINCPKCWITLILPDVIPNSSPSNPAAKIVEVEIVEAEVVEVEILVPDPPAVRRVRTSPHDRDCRDPRTWHNDGVGNESFNRPQRRRWTGRFKPYIRRTKLLLTIFWVVIAVLSLGVLGMVWWGTYSNRADAALLNSEWVVSSIPEYSISALGPTEMKPVALANLTAAKQCQSDDYLFLIGVTQTPAGSERTKLLEELDESSKIFAGFPKVQIKSTQSVSMSGFTFKEFICTVDSNGGMILRMGLIGSRIYSVVICSKQEIGPDHPIVVKFFRSVCINELPEPVQVASPPTPQPAIASPVPSPLPAPTPPTNTTPLPASSVLDIWVEKEWKELGLTIFLPSKVELDSIKFNPPSRKYYTGSTIFSEGKFTYKLNAEKHPFGFPDPKMSEMDVYLKEEVLKTLDKNDEYVLVDVKMPGATAKDFSMKKNGITTLKRIVIRGNQRVILTVEKSGSDIDAKTPEVKKYFDSLQLE